MIEINHVSKTFGTKKAVDDITVTIPTGCITGFIGPNGAGKTTSIHMMTGVLQPDTGSIKLNGKDITKDPMEAKREFGLVPDSPDLFLRLSGLEYINFMADLYHIDTATRNARIKALAEQFEIQDALNDRMSSYSHGMRQKAILIATLVTDPNIWILDEPMTGLDPASSYLLKEKMKEHARQGNTVIFSTHVLEVAEKLCDKIIIIDHGKIRYDGTLEALKAQYPEKESLEDVFLEVTRHA